MNQQQLIFIREIARTGTIRGAAACVDRTPSALTRGLKSVENELGCQLFRRIREGMVPTSEGETVLSYGERILKSLQEIKEKRIWSENEIRYLLCIRENKSITGAAETLFIATAFLHVNRSYDGIGYERNALYDIRDDTRPFYRVFSGIFQ